jgi:hypothetical protein
MTRRIAVTALALLTLALPAAASAAPAGASPPDCAIKNERNHKDYTTLQAAVDAAHPDDTITVKGTCLGQTLVSDSLTIIGVISSKIMRVWRKLRL